MCGAMSYIEHFFMYYPIEFYVMKSKGKGHGFAFIPIEDKDKSFENVIKDKIALLYKLYFGEKVKIAPAFIEILSEFVKIMPEFVKVTHDSGYHEFAGPGPHFIVIPGPGGENEK